MTSDVAARAAVRAELTELRGEWTLRLHADAGLAEALRAALGGPLSMRISPNLVPGEPFEVATVEVVAAAGA